MDGDNDRSDADKNLGIPVLQGNSLGLGACCEFADAGLTGSTSLLA